MTIRVQKCLWDKTNVLEAKQGGELLPNGIFAHVRWNTDAFFFEIGIFSLFAFKSKVEH